MSDAAKLIPIEHLAEAVPEWPLSPWSTRSEIRSKRLGCVRMGRRLFVTRELLDEYIAANTERPTPVARRKHSR